VLATALSDRALTAGPAAALLGPPLSASPLPLAGPLGPGLVTDASPFGAAHAVLQKTDAAVAAARASLVLRQPDLAFATKPPSMEQLPVGVQGVGPEPEDVDAIPPQLPSRGHSPPPSILGTALGFLDDCGDVASEGDSSLEDETFKGWLADDCDGFLA